MSEPLNAVSQRFSLIRELMEVVFSFLEPDSNARNAQVCKFWSEIALDLLWRDVDRFGRLLNLLAPTERAGCRLILLRPITLDDWQRFSHYAYRVRRLSLDDDGLYKVCLTALQEIARTRISFKILPNLCSFTWLAADAERRKFSVLFMHTGVTQYTTYADPSLSHHTDVARRIPNVTFLDLRLYDTSVQNLVEVVAGFLNLREIVLPYYQLTSNVMEGLAKLKNLERIELSRDRGHTRCLGTRDSLARFAPQLEVGAFPKLTTLHFILHMADATRFFQSPHLPPNLKSIRIDALSVQGESAVSEFFTTLSEKYPNLQYLHFECIPCYDFKLSRSRTWTIDTIRPMFKCAQLTTFRVIHHSPISLAAEDLTEISKTWAAIETLILNPEPFINSPSPQSSLTLSSLFPFALNCPKLQQLGLYINATTVALPPCEAVPGQFEKLTCLCVGASSISAPAEVAKFLSHLIRSPGCEIDAEILWADDDQNPQRAPGITAETKEAIETWDSKWGEVGLLLPALIRAKVDNTATIKSLEERVRELEKEAQRLRAQVQRSSSRHVVVSPTC